MTVVVTRYAAVGASLANSDVRVCENTFRKNYSLLIDSYNCYFFETIQIVYKHAARLVTQPRYKMIVAWFSDVQKYRYR